MVSLSQSRIAAYLQERIARRREEVGLYTEVLDLLQLPEAGRILELVCGSGHQLKILNQRNPGLELYGLDLSAAAIRNAKRNLEGNRVDLHQGSIESTDFEDDFFGVVTCFTSMSYWNYLALCYDEIFRILRPGDSAQLVEPQK